MTEAQDIEYTVCEERIADIRHMKDVIEEDMPEDVREIEKKSALGRAYDNLTQTEYALMGRLNELEEEYCVKYERYYGMSGIFKEYAEEARDAGVNFVALWEKCSSYDMRDAIEYIQVNGLASVNYEATCEAIEKYRAEKYDALRIA